MFKKTQLCTAVLAAMAGSAVYAQDAQPAQEQQPTAQAQRVEITGSRIKRSQAEGSLPVTIVSRAEIEASGANTVAEFVRNSTFSSTGNFRPQSGSSAQSFSSVDLRGLGAARTLVLVDGRRVAKAPNVGDAADMNSIPMAAVERVEILTDGASAIYGSDAIGGVINFILRKDFEGAHVSAGVTKTNITGGDRKEASAMFGTISEKGRFLAGLSFADRGIIYVRDYPWEYTRGASSYSNGLRSAIPDPENPGSYFVGGLLSPKYAGSCDFADKGFYVDASGACRYDYNLVAADEAALSTLSFFARGEHQINDDWSAYLNSSVTRKTSFGRYAPVPDSVLITPGSVFDQQHNVDAGGEPYFLMHRFAAAGNRDTSTVENLYDMSIGVRGVVGNHVDVDFGVRRTVSSYVETGRGFIVRGLATQAINDGTYNVDDPFSNSDEVLKGITHTTGRDSLWAQNEIYGSASFGNLFNVGMGGSDAGLFVGGEYRTEAYADLYDSLSEAGQVLGSSGSSANGKRTVASLSGELLVPLTKELETTFAARYERYSDYGNDFSPKVSLRYQPTSDLSLRASVGRGFRAPSLPDLNQKPAFSADSVVDYRQCMADGGFTDAECRSGDQSFQINGLRISNPTLGSEKSNQWSLGGTWDVTPEVSLKADYWNTKINNVITFVSAQEIVNRDNGDSLLPIPSGLSIRRDPATGAILQIVSGSANEGVMHWAGLDVDVRVQYSLADFGSMRHDLKWSHMTKASLNGVNQLGLFGFPKDRASIANLWRMGDFSTSWNVNFIGRNGEKDSDLKVGAYVTHDVQVAWDTPVTGLKMAVGAVNVLNKRPALVSDSSKPFNYALYDAYGRQLYVRVEQKF